MKKILLFILFLSLLNNSSIAGHLLGGDSRIEQISANDFVVHIRMMTSCSGVSAPLSIFQMKIFDQSTNSVISTHTLARDSIVNYPLSTSIICFNINYYSDTITLSNNPNGYYLTYRHGPRSGGTIINYPNPTAEIWTCDIPDPAIAGRNSNPIFNGNPMSTGICVGQTNTLNFSSTDPDGDNLTYSLVDTYDNYSNSQGKPYQIATFNTGYNLTNLLGPSALCTINSSTGILTARPSQMGPYIIAVKCVESRNGVKIGETIRDYLIISSNCPTTSINKKNLDKLISVYPNPSNGIFTIKAPTPTILLVYNVYGVNVHEQYLNNLTNQIELKNCSKGIYTLRLLINNEIFIKKIVVN